MTNHSKERLSVPITAEGACRGGGRQRSSESSHEGGESRSEEEHRVRDGFSPFTLGTHRRPLHHDPAVSVGRGAAGAQEYNFMELTWFLLWYR